MRRMSKRALTGAFNATGQSAAFSAIFDTMPDNGIVPTFNMSLWGTFVGTVALERSFDGGTVWLPLTALGQPINFTGPCSEVFNETEEGVLYRLNCTAYTSGTINWRLSL